MYIHYRIKILLGNIMEIRVFPQMGYDEMGYIPFIKDGIQETSLNLIFQSCYFFVFFLHYQSVFSTRLFKEVN